MKNNSSFMIKSKIFMQLSYYLINDDDDKNTDTMVNDKVKILIAEDEQITAMDFKRTLQELGYNVTAVVTSGEDLVQEIEKEIPTLIISDINLRGELDGIEAIARIQERHKVPFIYITAYKDYKRVVEIYNLNPCEYILKPVGSAELGEIVKTCLQNLEKDGLK